MPAYLEFIQHHLLMGASHIFLTAPFTWGGDIMTSFLRILRPFIQDGTVSMNSHADDDVDSLYSVRGADFSRDNVKIFQVTLIIKLLVFLITHQFLTQMNFLYFLM